MKTALALVLLLAACRISLDKEETGSSCKVNNTNPDCVDAPEHQDLAWLEAHVFEKSCTFSGCHNGMPTDAGRMDLRVGKSHASLVGVASEIEEGRTVVVPGEPNQSYLMVMIQHIAPGQADPPVGEPPASIGYMPQNAGGAVLCCQKLEALERWIEAGAPND